MQRPDLKTTPGFIIDIGFILLSWLGYGWLLELSRQYFVVIFFLLVPIRLLSVAGALYNYWDHITQISSGRGYYVPNNVGDAVLFWSGAVSFVFSFIAALGGGFFTLPVRAIREMGIPESWLGMAFWLNFLIVLVGIGGFKLSLNQQSEFLQRGVRIFQQRFYPSAVILLFILVQVMLVSAAQVIPSPVEELILNLFFGVAAIRLVIFFTPPFRLLELFSMLAAASFFLFRLYFGS